MTFAEETSVHPVSSAVIIATGRPCRRGDRGSHPRDSGRMLLSRRRFGLGDDDHARDHDAKSPAHARLARLQHRAMRLERRLERRQERRQGRDQPPVAQTPPKTTTHSKTTTNNLPHEILEDNENYRLRLVIPGYGPSSLTVSVGPFGHVLRIHGHKQTGLAKSKENRQDNHFKTAFKVQGKFDTSKLPHGAKAVLSNGILHVVIPKDPTYGEATPVAVSEAVVVPAVPVAAAEETDVGFELVDDEFVDVKTGTTSAAKVTAPTSSANDAASDDEGDIDEEECVEENMDDGDDDDDDDDESELEEDQAKQETKPSSDTASNKNGKMFRRLVEVPGVRLEDLKVEHECDGRILRVTAIRRAGGLTGHKKDRSIKKTFRLRPQQKGIDIANLTATLDHGVLCITAPRTLPIVRKHRGGKKNRRTHDDAAASERFLIPVTTTDGTEEEDVIVAGFESIDLTKTETTTKLHRP